MLTLRKVDVRVGVQPLLSAIMKLGMEEIEATDAVRRQAWRGAYDAFATGYLFEHRQRNLRRKLQLLSFTGLAVPLAVGLAVLAFGTAGTGWLYVLWIAGILGAAQAVLSLWSLVARWDERLAHASEAASANHDLSKRFRSLAESTLDRTSLAARLDILEAENKQRERADYQQDLTDPEKRRGHRATLRHFDKACKACKQVPLSLKPTKCDICGNF